MINIMYIKARDSDAAYRMSWGDMQTAELNYQLNSNYEITFTLTYIDAYKGAFNAAKAKADVFFNGEIYNIQQADTSLSKDGLLQLKCTASHSLIDKMRNVRIDDTYPTEDNPQSSGGSTGSSGQKQPGVVIKQTDAKPYYTLQDRLDQFIKNNDQGVKYELHGNFPSAQVEIKNTSLYEWLNQNLKNYGAYYIPVGNTLKVYDLMNLQHPTGRQFRYQNNMDEADVQIDVNDLVNDCDIYAGKMEKDITTGAGGSGNLDNVEGFAKSPINADFGVDKNKMIQDFASRDVRVQAWGVDANRLYDTVKSAGVSPEWFFAYDLQEGNPTSYSWLNHYGSHLADPYGDATRVCNWIKSIANSDGFTPASYDGRGVDGATAAKWNQEFGKGTIGRLYLQGTAAAVWEMANMDMGRYGRPLAGCMNQIKAWGGHSGGVAGAKQVADYLKSFVGKVPYVWGGSTPSGWDCSGMMCYVLNHFGINTPRTNTIGLESKGDIVSPPYQTGDLLFWGPRGGSYHVSMAVDADWRVGADNERDGTVLMRISQWPPSFAVRIPAMSKFAQGDPGLSGNQTNTTNQTYYQLHYHYEDQDSIKRYGRHHGKPLTFDSIYDMNLLKQQVDITVQHNPKTTLSVKDFFENDFAIGDVWDVIIPEINLKVAVTLLGIKYKPFNPDNSNATLSFNNSGLVMQNVINAIYRDIRGIGLRADEFNNMSALITHTENHFNNIVTLDEDQMKKLQQWTEGGSQ